MTFKELLLEVKKKERKVWFKSKKKREEHGLDGETGAGIEKAVKKLKRKLKKKGEDPNKAYPFIIAAKQKKHKCK